MRIGVIGAGAIGGTLARHLTRLGHQVSIANSRGPDSLTALAAEIGATPVHHPLAHRRLRPRRSRAIILFPDK